MHAVVQIISSVPSTTSTSFVHTFTQTRDPGTLAFKQKGMHGELASCPFYAAEILRYYEGGFDNKSEIYSLHLTTDLQTERQIVVSKGLELIGHHVNVINLPTLAIKVRESGLDTLVAVTERLMELVM